MTTLGTLTHIFIWKAAHPEYQYEPSLWGVGHYRKNWSPKRKEQEKRAKDNERVKQGMKTGGDRRW